jgi:hypothetical protein
LFADVVQDGLAVLSVVHRLGDEPCRVSMPQPVGFPVSDAGPRQKSPPDIRERRMADGFLGSVPPGGTGVSLNPEISA